MKELIKTELDEMLAKIDEAVFNIRNRYLKDVETAILRGAIGDRTYEQIAEESGYSASYLKRDVGPKLWKLLSVALREKVSKTNFRQAVERYQIIEERSPLLPNRTEWGEAPDVSFFLGRTVELQHLTNWILKDSCRLIALLGIGGIGKTALGVKLARKIQGEFEFVIWCSLRNAPLLKILLAKIVPLVSSQQETNPELKYLLHYLRAAKCLLIFDNVESILEPMQVGQFRVGYENYGELLRSIGETNHQSCLIITSREKPSPIAVQEGKELPVRSLCLSGLQAEAEVLLTTKGLLGSLFERKTLIGLYGGNPLALKIAATSIRDLFEGKIANFLTEGTAIFNGVRQLLDEQFARLSQLEKTIMYWLALDREGAKVEDLLEDIMPPVSRNRLLEGLESLWWRNLIEKQAGKYTQQSVVMEYVCHRLIEKIILELTTGELDLFTRHALVKTTVREYVRHAQIRLILDPIAREWQKTLRSPNALKQQVLKLLQILRTIENPLSNYGGGNLINLCQHLDLDLSGVDLSELSIWHACLQEVELHGIDFTRADFSKALFAETFGNILCLAYSPDGKLLASGDSQGNIYLRQMPEGQIIKIYRAHQTWVLNIAFSPDGTKIASSSSDCSVKIWTLTTGKPSYHFKHDNVANGLAWSPDGTKLASAGFDGTLRFWDCQTGKCLKVLQGNAPQITLIAWSPDGKILACPDGDKNILLWDAISGKLLETLPEREDKVWSVAFSPDGQTLASSSQDGKIELWNVSSRKCLQNIQGNFNLVWRVVFSPDGKILAGACQDGKVRLWATDTGKCLKILQGHACNVWSVAFSPDGRTLASGSDDRSIKLWDVAAGDCLTTWQGHTSAVWDVNASKNSQQLASAHQDGTIRLWAADAGNCLKTLRGHKALVWSIIFSPNGDLLASASQDGTVRVWDVTTGQCLNTFKEHSSLILSVIWHPNGRSIASASPDSTVKIWNYYTGECEMTLEHQVLVSAVTWNRDGDIIASGCHGGILKLWDSSTGRCLKSIQGHVKVISSVNFSPDGQTLASCSHDNTVKLWNLKTGECLHTFAEHTDWVCSVAWHPEAQILASASKDGTIRFWNLASGQCCQILRGHSSEVRSLSWSHRGKYLVSGSLDETIKLWNPDTGQCFKTLRAKQPYEGTNITGITGITKAQQTNLIALGAKLLDLVPI